MGQRSLTRLRFWEAIARRMEIWRLRGMTGLTW